MSLNWDDKALMRKFDALETKVARAAIRKGVRAGRKTTLAVAKTNAAGLRKSGTGMSEKIRSALKLRVTPKSTLHRKDSYAMEVLIDPKITPEFLHVTKEGKKYYIPYAIEYGHAAPGDGGSKDKFVLPKPFMIPAHEMTRNTSIYMASRVIADEIKKAWNR